MDKPPITRDRHAPPGWDTNPSSWRARVPLLGIALVAFTLVTAPALHRLGFAPRPWEPFFDGVSHGGLQLPAPYLALGAGGFLVFAGAAVLGGRQRWQTMPWLVVLFGLLASSLAAGSVLVVIVEPVLYDAWSTSSLLTALLAVLTVGPAMAEVLASLQLLKRVRARDRSVWKALWGMPEDRLASFHATATGS